jgi:hypothetical protein
MSENTQPDIASQFRELGENLKNIFKTTWESDEAQTLKEELKNGLDELGNATVEAVEDFKVSEAGQKLKDEAEDIKARVESGELEALKPGKKYRRHLTSSTLNYKRLSIVSQNRKLIRRTDMALVHSENRVGKPIKVADYTLIPIERVLTFQPPGMWGALLWRRPSSVVIQHPDGPDEVLEIQDQTRQAQIFLLAFGVVTSIIIMLLNNRSNGRRRDNV